MNYHFLVFTDGKPLAVHNHFNPIKESFYVWTPPLRDKPYQYRSGNKIESVYALLFPMTQDDRDRTGGSSPFSPKRPPRLETQLALLDLLFTKNVDDFGVYFRQFSSLLPRDVVLVTDYGVRGWMSLMSVDSAFKEDCVLAHDDQLIGSECFMNIVDYAMTKKSLPIKEAFDYACSTNVLGDYLYATVPQWWSRAFEQYGSSHSCATTRDKESA